MFTAIPVSMRKGMPFVRATPRNHHFIHHVLIPAKKQLIFTKLQQQANPQDRIPQNE
jgi:hypothetical protein